MTYKEPDHETVIVQKLRAMEDALKSFMASLGEPLQRKGRKTQVKAGRHGIIHKWHWNRGSEVQADDTLCTINIDPLGLPAWWKFHDVFAPIKGILYIEKSSGWVEVDTVIAQIDPT